MKKFIGIPNLFKGVSGDTSSGDLIIVALIDRNTNGFLTCYRKASQLVRKLDSVQDIFKVGADVEVLFTIHADWLWGWMQRV